VSASAVDDRIRSLRPPKPYVDPFKAHGTLVEDERRPGGKTERALTVFLAGAECPFTCAFCDLWRWTIDGPTPPGALTRQLGEVIAALDGPRPDRIKLYNASNFFDQRSVPEEDQAGIPTLVAEFAAVTVESHANTIGPRVVEFSRRIPGRLEVAVGLETVHPRAIEHLNKRLDLARFDSAARFLLDNGIDLRVFVLIGVPCVPAKECVDWTVRSVEYAVERGASIVSIIPLRGGNGEMERLQSIGEFVPPTLAQLEETIERCSEFRDSVVTADLWDIERLTACDNCRTQRVERLARLNVVGGVQPPVVCGQCAT